jgi:hypothetical protein
LLRKALGHRAEMFIKIRNPLSYEKNSILFFLFLMFVNDINSFEKSDGSFKASPGKKLPLTYKARYMDEDTSCSES